MKNTYFNTIEDFKETQPAKKLISFAIKEIQPNKKNWFGFVLSVFLGTLVAIIIGFSPKTVNLFVDTLKTLINIQLGLFGCIFAVYSIILAFLSDSFMKKLAKILIKENQSALTQYTTYYESVLFLYFINVGLTGILLILCNCLPTDFRLTSNWVFDCALASFLMIVYFSFSFRVFYEIKSTIYNTIVLFRASIAYKFISFMDESNSDR